MSNQKVTCLYGMRRPVLTVPVLMVPVLTRNRHLTRVRWQWMIRILVHDETVRDRLDKQSYTILNLSTVWLVVNFVFQHFGMIVLNYAL